MRNFPHISIIFPTYNGEKFLKKMLNSIERLDNINEIEIVIIDNNSRDSTLNIIKSFDMLNILLIKSDINLGYGKACNIGSEKARGKFLFFTNQDVEFQSDFFSKLKILFEKLENSKKIVISPAMVFENKSIDYFGAKIHFLGFSYTPIINRELPKEKKIKKTRRFSGGSFYIKKQDYLGLKGFDQIYFMYYEDTDLSLKMIRNGYKIYTTNEPYLIHQKHKFYLNDFRYFLLERNRIIFYIKNIDNFWMLFPFFIITELTLLVHSILIKKFNIRIRLYYQLLSKINKLIELRNISKNNDFLVSYQKLSRNVDHSLIFSLKYEKIYGKFLKLLNRIYNLI